MRYVTASQMKEIDRTAIDKHGVPASRLMENAGAAVADEALKSLKEGDILVVSGYGNNGGDGFVAARHLIKKGRNVIVFLAGRPRPFSRETGDNFKALIESGSAPRAVYDTAGMEKAFAGLPRCGLIIDALFGIGIKGRLDDFYIALIDRINAVGATVISVDLPSGLDADTGAPCPVAVKAAKTVTLALPKAGFNNPDAKAYTGEVVVADIGIPPAAVDSVLRMAGKDAD